MTTMSQPAPVNIASWVRDQAATNPELPAIKQGDTVLRYAELESAASRFATTLSDHGVTAGDRVAMIMPNVAFFPIVYYAILRVGAIAVPMNPLLKAGEISFVWRDCAAKVAVVFPLFAEEADKAAGATGRRDGRTVPGEFEKALASTEPPSRLPGDSR
jgi:long-chain acyl-CoA synthetase